MSTDLTVLLENKPGTLAELGETLGGTGINILGVCGLPVEGRGLIHILVEDPAVARRVLEEAGFEVGEARQVLTVDIEDQPGEMGKITRRSADAGVNVDLLYTTGAGKLVLGVDDLEKARAAL